MFRKVIAIPQQHGSWALWLCPYAVGIFMGGFFRGGLVWLTLASLAAFMALQPLTILVKVLSGRRPRDEARIALFWLGVYGIVALAGALGMFLGGNGFIILLAGLALPVLAWQMWLVAHHAERRQMMAEIAGCGALALATPAGLWVDKGFAAPVGWILFGLVWMQSAGSIAYTYARLEQRRMKQMPAPEERWRVGRVSLVWNAINLLVVMGLGLGQVVPWLAVVPFAFMLAEVAYGTLARPCVGAKPAVIGMRQTVIAVLFGLMLVAAFRWSGGV